jgi:hypothetical protein
LGGGFDALEQVNEQDKGVVDPVRITQSKRDEEVCPQVRGFLFRQLKGDDKLPVPQPAVVGGGVAQDTKVVQQGTESFLVEPITRQDSHFKPTRFLAIFRAFPPAQSLF